VAYPPARVNLAGGFFYHVRAASAGRRWRPFTDALGAWLTDCLPASPRLVLVGPSAAYCLEDAFLSRYPEITALEPDPVARWLLARRARRLGIRSLEFVTDDRLVAPLVEGRPALDDVLDGLPAASVVFCNVLGQVRFLLAEPEHEKWQLAWTERIAPRLCRHPWASFHDRVSAAVPPRLTMPHRAPSRLSDQEMVRTFYGGVAGRVELLDHLTGRLFPEDLSHAYFHWELERGAHHLIEAVGLPRSGTVTL